MKGPVDSAGISWRWEKILRESVEDVKICGKSDALHYSKSKRESVSSDHFHSIATMSMQ